MILHIWKFCYRWLIGLHVGYTLGISINFVQWVTGACITRCRYPWNSLRGTLKPPYLQVMMPSLMPRMGQAALVSGMRGAAPDRNELSLQCMGR